MGDDKSPRSLSPLGGRDRDRELLIPVSGGGSAPGDGDGDGDRAALSSASAALSSSGREAFHKVVRSWASKKFMTGCVILFPIAITFYITWWFIHFVDGFFSPIYAQLGINVFERIGVKRSTLHSWFKQGMLRHHSNTRKPCLKEENKIGRLQFCLSMLDQHSLQTEPKFIDMRNIIYIDEKWFNATKKIKELLYGSRRRGPT